MPSYFYDLSVIGELSSIEFETICRGACRSVYVGNDTVLANILTKFMVYADANDIGITPHFCFKGYWESWISRCFARVVKKGWNCIDIGANQGYFHLLLSDLIGSKGRLAAVEPNPKLCEFLSKNL